MRRLERVLWQEHRVCNRLQEFLGMKSKVPSDMTNDVASRRFMRVFIEPENRAIQKVVEQLGPVSYLDVGTGSGRFVAIAKDRTERIVGIDINERCVARVKERFEREVSEGKVEVLNTDVRCIPLQNESIDVVMCIGNTVGIYFYEGRGRSYQVEALKEMLRVAKQEVMITLHSRAMLRESLRYYRMNGIEVDTLNDGLVLGAKFASKKFSQEDVEKLMGDARIPKENYELTAINRYLWMVRIRTKRVDSKSEEPAQPQEYQTENPKLFPLTIARTVINEYLGIKADILKDDEVAAFRKHWPWKYALSRFIAYAGLGLGLGKVMSWAFSTPDIALWALSSDAGRSLGLSFNALRFIGGIGVALGVGAIPLVTKKIFGEKTESKGKTGLLFSLDSIAGELVFPTTIGIASALSGFVSGPVSGLGVGVVAMLGGYIIGTLTFYGLWAVFNIKKYLATGFGKLEDLKMLPKHFAETIKTVWQKMKEMLDEIRGKDIVDNKSIEPLNKEVLAEPFLAEFAEMHGKGAACALPYYLARPLAGIIAGLLYPHAFVDTFTAVMMAVSPYIYPIYANFYGLVAARANSIVKKKQ